MDTDSVLSALSTIGIVAFSVSGSMVGINRGADLFGTLVLGAVTATGGGIMRDILLGRLPPASMLDTSYIIVAMLCSLVIFITAFSDKQGYQKNSHRIDSLINILDALGLGVFCVSGTNNALCCGLSYVAAVLVGTLTGVGGGVLRDILTSQMPVIFKKRIYAVAGILGSSFFCFLCSFLPFSLSAFFAGALTFVLRMAATYYNWNLPSVCFEERIDEND